MDTIKVLGLQYWAQYLIKGDTTCMSKAAQARVAAWARDNGVDVGDCLSGEGAGVKTLPYGKGVEVAHRMVYTFSVRK